MSAENPKFGKTIKNDFRETDIKKSFKKDYSEVSEYFLTENEQNRLDKMGKFRRWFFKIIWLLKKLFFKLSPFRRILLIAGSILILLNRSGNDNSTVLPIIGGLILLFLIMLELKDKLIAKTELEEGHAVQKALMPELMPDISGWSLWLYTRPANDVGGDLIDFQKLNGERFGISLGDISGKGLSAALLMSKLQATLRALCSESGQLSGIIKKINRIFYNDTPQNSFASLIYFELKSNSGEIKYVNAGHLPPVIIKMDSLHELPKGSPALGLMPEVEYKENILKMEQNDLLIAFSDGLTEAENENREFYGKKRALALFNGLKQKSVQSIGESITKNIDDFIGGAKIHDDISIVIMKKL